MQLRRVLWFSVVGGGVFAGTQLALFVLVSCLYWSSQVANVVVLALSVWASYDLNQRTAWRHMPRHARQVQRFVMARIGTVALSAMVFSTLTIGTGMHYLLANAVGVLVGMVVNYVIADKWVFTTAPSSADHRLTWKTAARAMTVVGMVVVTAWTVSPTTFISVVFTGLALIAIAAVCLNLVAGLYVHRDEASWKPTPVLARRTGSSKERIAVLMPARHEGYAYGVTIMNAVKTQLDHPAYRVFPVICGDDPSTIRVALIAARVLTNADMRTATMGQLTAAFRREWASVAEATGELTGAEKVEISRLTLLDAPVQIHIFHLGNERPSKPKQLNYAFRMLERKGFTVFTILDAESMAQQGLFTYVDQVLQAHPEAAVVQGAVQLMDPPLGKTSREQFLTAWRRWFSWHNILEYHRWFSGQMAFQSDNEFVPLGGNTVFVRTEVLSATDGWPLSLTEDCALGVQISTRLLGKVVVFYDPKLATREETPHTIRDLIKQRTRWNQGFLESFIAGAWQSMPTTRQRFLAFWILSGPFFQAVSVFLLPVAVVLMVTGILKSPVLLVLIMFVPISLSVLMVALQIQQLHDFGQTYHRRIPFSAYVAIVMTQPLYQWILSVAALRAVIRHTTGQIAWQSPARSGDLVIGLEYGGAS